MNYIRFINCYKQNSLTKKKYYYYIYDNKTNKLIHKFMELGLIKYTIKSQTSKNKIKIFINYEKNTTIFKNLKILYKLNKKQHINVKTLITQKKFKLNSVFLLSTSNGILTNFEALHQKNGGILLCQINY